MAFVARTSRAVSPPGAPSPERTPGPGAYLSQEGIRPPRTAPAPFGSTSTRTGLESRNEVPAPRLAHEPVRIHTNAALESPFGSLTRRFVEKPDDLPGPGAYDPLPPSRLGPRSRSPMGSPSRHGDGSEGGSGFKWVRMPTAPSVPARNQAYGYDEGVHGELVPKPPPPSVAVALEGEPGPGSYDAMEALRRMDTKGGRGTHFAAYRSRRSDLAKGAAETPGPGSYALRSSDRPKTAGVGASVFRSRTERSSPVARAQASVPGPGEYEWPGALQPQRKRGPVPSSFGSRSDRFRHGILVTSDSPGPGAYDPAPAVGPTAPALGRGGGPAEVAANTMALLSPIRVGGGGATAVTSGHGGSGAQFGPSAARPSSNPATLAALLAARRPKTGFTSTASRFTERRREAAPDVGTYEYRSAFEPSPLDARRHTTQTHFGSTASRFFKPGKGSKVLRPGSSAGAAAGAAGSRPGTAAGMMEREAFGGLAGALGPSSRHAPEVEVIETDASAPGPGDYVPDLVPSERTRERLMKPSSTFASGVDRFSDLVAKSRLSAGGPLGPGQYSVSDASAWAKPSFSRKVQEEGAGLMASGPTRFRPEATTAAATPGPGSYALPTAIRSTSPPRSGSPSGGGGGAAMAGFGSRTTRSPATGSTNPAAVPGPGSYGTRPSWNTRTFNITVAEEEIQRVKRLAALPRSGAPSPAGSRHPSRPATSAGHEELAIG